MIAPSGSHYTSNPWRACLHAQRMYTRDVAHLACASYFPPAPYSSVFGPQLLTSQRMNKAFQRARRCILPRNWSCRLTGASHSSFHNVLDGISVCAGHGLVGVHRRKWRASSLAWGCIREDAGKTADAHQAVAAEKSVKPSICLNEEAARALRPRGKALPRHFDSSRNMF